ncbi:MAG TPA: heme exporter protein CcmD [Gammaproteobacteria bacterium]
MMSAIAEFFYFSGYAWYVWGSYGVTAAFMIAEVILVIRGKRSTMNRLARMVRLNNSSSE